jgi:anti-sigma factor RsiW
MTCKDFEAQLGAYIDEELPAEAARDMAAHLGGCAACARAHERQLALRAAIQEQVPAFRAPDRLRASIRHAIRAEAGFAVARRLPQWRWLAAAALLVGVVAGTWRLATTRATTEVLTEEVLASHVRSLMGSHLMDVASSDQHTVKPWFNGKLDYSPSVYDLAGQGYPLVGGRLDYVANRAVAALVYGRRQHVISVFLWPTERGPTGGPPAVTRQGYHMLHWTAPDYAYWVVSDLGTADLREFSLRLQEADSAARVPQGPAPVPAIPPR